MCKPKCMVGSFHYCRCGEDINNAHDGNQEDSGDAGYRAEEPIAYRRHEV